MCLFTQESLEEKKSWALAIYREEKEPQKTRVYRKSRGGVGAKNSHGRKCGILSMVQELPGEVVSGHPRSHRNSKWLINTYKSKTALGVGGKEECKLETAFGPGSRIM